jgi:hypothetical protein
MNRNLPFRAPRIAGLLAAAVAACAQTPPAAAADPPPAARRIATQPGVRVLVPNARFKFESRESVGFDLDAATLGALSIADVTARLGTHPAGVALPFDGPGGALRVQFDADAKRLRVMFAGGGELASIPAEPPGRPLRLCLRQRDQAALFVVPPEGGPAPLVWAGRVDYRLHLPDADQYLLCRDLLATMGTRGLRRADVLEGILVDSLDEVATVRIEGVSPTGLPFAHEYPFDAKAIEDRIDRSVGDLMRMLQAGGIPPAGAAHANP